VGGWGAGARDRAPAPGPLRCGLLRLAGRGLPSAWGDAESDSARVPRGWHAGAVLPRERDPVGGRAAQCGCGRCDDGAVRVARRRVLARRVPADGRVGIWTVRDPCPLAAIRAPGRWEFGPDGLAVRSLAGPPALGELRYEEQAASALVEGEGPAEVRGGAAAVGDLADERLVPDETQLDRARGVPDRVSYQFADHKPGNEYRIVE